MSKIKNSNTKCWWECREKGWFIYLVGMYSAATTVENNLAVSLKTKHLTGIWSSNCAPGHLFQRNNGLCSHKNLYTDVYSSFIHDSPKVKTNQMSFSRWVIKQSMFSFYPHLFCTLDYNDKVHWYNHLDVVPEDYAECEQQIQEGYVLCGSIYMTFLKGQKL